MQKEIFLGLLLALLPACIGPIPVENLRPWDQLSPDAQRKDLTSSADEIAGNRRYRVGIRKFSHDCSGYVGAVLYQNGIDVFRGATVLQMKGYGVQLLHEFTMKYGRLYKENPQVGDLVFFSNTYDRDRDHKNDDRLTHVGIITKIDSDGTLTFSHHLSDSSVEDKMNLRFPFVHKQNHKEINSFLRRRSRKDPVGTRYLAGQLFVRFGSLVTQVGSLTNGE